MAGHRGQCDLISLCLALVSDVFCAGRLQQAYTGASPYVGEIRTRVADLDRKNRRFSSFDEVLELAGHQQQKHKPFQAMQRSAPIMSDAELA